MELFRVAVAARAFGLAMMSGLALLAQDPAAYQTLVLGAAVSVAGVLLSTRRALRGHLIAVGEGVGAALLVGSSLADATLMLPYLAVAAFLAGLYGGGRFAGLALVSQVIALLVINLVSGDVLETAVRTEVATWLALAAGLGIVGTLLHTQQVQQTAADTSYRDARSLLAQLRALSTRLTEGLDPVSAADRIMARAAEELDAVHAGVLLEGEDGTPLPLAYSSRDAASLLADSEPLVARCLGTGQPVNRGTRRALPLRTDDHLVAALVLECATPPSEEAVERCVRGLVTEALRLDTALLFDAVRGEATAEERQRLAREVHDGIAQDVASLGYLVDDLLFTTDEEERTLRIKELRGELTRVVSELRLSVFDLRNRVESTEGLGSALSAFARQIGSRSDMTVHLTLDEGPTRLRSDVEQELLRIAQEAMNNARKHSGGTNLWVRCTVYPPYAEIVVRDDGAGLGEAADDSQGLRIMRERVARIGADLEISDEGPLAGTTLAVRLDGPATGAYPAEDGDADFWVAEGVELVSEVRADKHEETE
ncbi:MAG: histidine kinase [Nocardioides sp.]|nr:histidine kinase [Nocardioides sp.]